MRQSYLKVIEPRLITVDSNYLSVIDDSIQAGKRGLLSRFIIFMAWVVGIGLILSLVTCQPVHAKPIASDNSSGYYINLSKITSGQASRYLLAFFVPDNGAASQAVTVSSSTAPKAHLRATRGYSLISIANHLLTDYDGLTLQNKIAERRICGAASSDAESKTRHPILYSVALTHKSLGGSYHG